MLFLKGIPFEKTYSSCAIGRLISMQLQIEHAQTRNGRACMLLLQMNGYPFRGRHAKISFCIVCQSVSTFKGKNGASTCKTLNNEKKCSKTTEGTTYNAIYNESIILERFGNELLRSVVCMCGWGWCLGRGCGNWILRSFLSSRFSCHAICFCN